MTSPLTETRHAGAFIVAELEQDMSRMQVTIAESQTLKAGAVLGRTGATDAQPIVVKPAVKAPDFVGAGTLDLAADPKWTSAVNEGTYRIVCKTKNAGGGVFTVTDPLGNALADATEGAAYTTEIKFTINASGADFEVGDTFLVEVFIPDLAATGEYCEFDPDGTDGSEVAVAVLVDDVTTGSGATGKGVVIYKDAVVRLSDLVWQAAITTEQKSTGLGYLNEKGIVAR